jgi:hypothetical protein
VRLGNSEEHQAKAVFEDKKDGSSHKELKQKSERQNIAPRLKFSEGNKNEGPSE